MKDLEEYQNALQKIYDHVGFEEDFVVCPIDGKLDMFWGTDGKIVMYADTKDELISQYGNYYEDDVYTQRFYEKHIYEGAEYTMIFCDPKTDGMKWFRIFDNKKRYSNLIPS